MKADRHLSKNFLSSLLVAAGLLASVPIHAENEFRPGEVWRDVGGQPIQPHGGGVLLHRNVYYWYGEDRTPGIDSAVSCYSSTNLSDWKREGVALWDKDLPMVNGQRVFVERPKVIYNARTKKFVMWMHVEQGKYIYSHAGIAVSDHPKGPFKFLRAIRPVANGKDFAKKGDDPARQREWGGTFRDMNLFLDADGRAYVFYAADYNWTMYVARLNDDFTGPETPAVENQNWAKILLKEHREAPAPFKWKGRYYLITSGCSGWAPNAASYSTAENLLGPWKTFGNPCTGPDASQTFGAQSTFVLPAPGQPDHFIFMADRWNPKDLPDSRYIWLPLKFTPDGKPKVHWQDRWTLSAEKWRWQ